MFDETSIKHSNQHSNIINYDVETTDSLSTNDTVHHIITDALDDPYLDRTRRGQSDIPIDTGKYFIETDLCTKQQQHNTMMPNEDVIPFFINTGMLYTYNHTSFSTFHTTFQGTTSRKHSTVSEYGSTNT